MCRYFKSECPDEYACFTYDQDFFTVTLKICGSFMPPVFTARTIWILQHVLRQQQTVACVLEYFVQSRCLDKLTYGKNISSTDFQNWGQREYSKIQLQHNKLSVLLKKDSFKPCSHLELPCIAVQLLSLMRRSYLLCRQSFLNSPQFSRFHC